MTPTRIALPDWQLARAPAGRYERPADLERAGLSWTRAHVPGTVAEALRSAGAWSLSHPTDFDADDWWFRCTFAHPGPRDGRYRLVCEGLATLATVWLNGAPVIEADNMFRRWDATVSHVLEGENELVIRFRSLGAALAARRPRPRWKTKLVAHQQWRWFRTTLLGRIPGWTPPVAPVGPWRDVVLQHETPGSIVDTAVHTSVEGTDGFADVSCRVCHPADALVEAVVHVGPASARAAIARDSDGYRVHARVPVDQAALWWPHTHGRPDLHACGITLAIDGRRVEHHLTSVGFRTLRAVTDDEGFAIEVNGVPLFCRGACRTVSDIVSLSATPDELARELALLRQAGANMIRIGGTMVYESDDFYRLCDEMGILVWQDFMFANMDYPADDARFMASVEAEAAHQLARLRSHPCVAVYCGNSEVEQQAAMLGVDRGDWRNRLFADVLPALCARMHPGVPYVPSTPSGGDLPFQAASGVTHYYGVGAYRRPIEDARRAEVRFTPECLGFSNVPDDVVVAEVMDGQRAAPHDPRWKARVPRDSGAGWDFEDVRDHYVAELFSVDPVRLRAVDPARYLALSRVATGEVMARVFAEWRRGRSTCGGGLVWFLRDLWPGAGWGILDSRGEPKACFYYLSRVWQPQAVVITDEGLNGLHAHVINDTAHALEATLEVALLGAGHVRVAGAAVPVHVDPRSTRLCRIEALLDRFFDASYAYRFGPPVHDVVAATLTGADGRVLADTFWLRDPAAVAATPCGALVARASRADDGTYEAEITSERFAMAARIDADGFRADDNYVCLMPGRPRRIRVRPVASPAPAFDGFVDALNLDHPVRVEVGVPQRTAAS